MLKPKIMWQVTRSFIVMKEKKCERSSSMCRVTSVGKGIRPTLDFTKANHTYTFDPLKNLPPFMKIT